MKCLTLILTLLWSWAASADDTAVRGAVERMLGHDNNIDVAPSAMDGVSEVAVGTQVFYVSNDGRYLLGGPLIDATSRANLTERRVAGARRAILAAADTPRFRWPADEPRHRITVVTDIDCPYCRRMHNDMAEYQAAGIDVSYLMLPRAGRDSPAYRKTVNAACAADPEAAITQAMSGQTPEPGDCQHPIDEHMALARALGVTSTPTIVLEDGRVILGQKPPARLLAEIENGAER